jgi:plasmid replication initiation protein
MPSTTTKEPSAKEFVVKSNQLVEACYHLTLIEQQIILYAICRSREEQLGLSSDSLLTIHASAFVGKFDTNRGEVYRQMKSAMTTLHTRSVKFYKTHPETGKASVIDTPWISRGNYIDGAGQFQIQFAHEIIPLITRLESRFTAYRLDRIERMTSVHAIRLYELMAQYLPLGKRTMEIAKLKEILQLTKQYAAIRDFKKWVVNVAVREINEHSNLIVGYKQQKTGRAVTHLLFDIKLKPKRVEITPKKAGDIRRTMAIDPDDSDNQADA